jgi:CheY-like chemotaxis protein
MGRGVAKSGRKYYVCSTSVRGTNPESFTVVRGDGPAMTSTTSTQKVVIINGSAEVLELLETVLDAGHYDVVFVESSAHAYSQIKRVNPDLVILCVRMQDGDGLQVLSMLKLDADTRSIPVLTYATEGDSDETEEAVPDTSDEEIFVSKPAVWMN